MKISPHMLTIATDKWRNPVAAATNPAADALPLKSAPGSSATGTVVDSLELRGRVQSAAVDNLSAAAFSPSLSNPVLSPEESDIVHCLKSAWLESAEKVIAARYGLTADGAVLEIELEPSAAPYLAAVYYQNDPSGKAVNQVLHITVPAALPATLPDGGTAPLYADRIITHEMTHAIMGRTMNYAALPIWFKEGAAEFVSGANERIAANLEREGGGMTGAVALQNALGDGTDQTWVNDSLHYAAATIAVRYLHDNIKANGHAGGIKDLMTDLKNNPDEDLDEALRHVSSYSSVAAFANDFVHHNMGAVYINRLDLAGQLNTADTGAIGGAGVDGGPALDAKTVVPDIEHYTETPLKYFTVIWPEDDATDGAAAAAIAAQLPIPSAAPAGAAGNSFKANGAPSNPAEAAAAFGQFITDVKQTAQSALFIAVQANQHPKSVLRLL